MKQQRNADAAVHPALVSLRAASLGNHGATPALVQATIPAIEALIRERDRLKAALEDPGDEHKAFLGYVEVFRVSEADHRKERDELLRALEKSQFVLVNLREHARHIRTCDAPEHPCTCELDELLEQSIDVVHGSSELIAKAGGQEQPHYPRQTGEA